MADGIERLRTDLEQAQKTLQLIMNDALGMSRKLSQLRRERDQALAEAASLRERIEELETRVSTLDIAVNHWQHNYKQLDLLYSQLAGRS